MDGNHDYLPGEVVYIIIRNPHVQDVAQVQQAAVVQHPDYPNEQALFIYETYYSLTKDLAVFKTESEAEQAFHQAFGTSMEGGLYG